MGLVEDPAYGEESLLHVLCHCDALARHRLKIFQVGYHTPEDIRKIALGETLFFTGRIGLT